MKKLFSLAILAAMALMVVSCSKDDDDTDSTANRLNFANKLTQNSTSGTWEGYETSMRKEGGWVDGTKRYAVIRFDRATTSDIKGTGQLVAFENKYMDTFREGSEFEWYFDEDMLHITWRHAGWQPAYAEYRTNELVIDGDTFRGEWFEKTDFKWHFSYTKSNFNDWSKYVNNQ